MLGDIPGFVQLIPGSYKSNEPVNNIGIDKVHLKCYWRDGRIVNGIPEPIWYTFAFDQPPGHKMFLEPWVKLFSKGK